MKLFGDRAIDYFRAAGPDDRRYLLFNPITKMKVTTEGEKVIDDLLWDVIAAKGFEKDTYFEMAARDIRGLPKLEGTVHVNMALVLKFMANYLFNPAELRAGADAARCGRRRVPVPPGPGQGPRQDPVRRLARRATRRSPSVPNVARFIEQAEGLGDLLATAAAERGAAEGARLPAHARGAVHARALRPADPGAGRACGVDADMIDADLRRARARLLERTPSTLHGHGLVHRGPAGLGARRTSASRSPTRTASRASGTRSSGTRAPTRCSPSRRRSRLTRAVPGVYVDLAGHDARLGLAEGIRLCSRGTAKLRYWRSH